MTGPAAQQSVAQSAGTIGDAWRAVREADDIQFAPVTPKPPPETPDWLEKLGEWLRELLEPLGRALGMSWPTLQYVLLALAVLLALVVAWYLLAPLVEQWRTRRPPPQEEEWAPDRDAAAALLADADRLAGEGRFGEAVHLLLQRSVADIAEARPDWLLPASTAREIARFPRLPERARSAFAVIAGRVERSLFALCSLDAADWTAARAAYAEFALAELPG